VPSVDIFRAATCTTATGQRGGAGLGIGGSSWSDAGVGGFLVLFVAALIIVGVTMLLGRRK